MVFCRSLEGLFDEVGRLLEEVGRAGEKMFSRPEGPNRSVWSP